MVKHSFLMHAVGGILIIHPTVHLMYVPLAYLSTSVESVLLVTYLPLLLGYNYVRL